MQAAATRAHERLAEARAARAALQHDPATPREALQIEGLRPADRPIILTTAEMLAHDQETTELARAMQARHQAELDQEALARRELTAAAAMSWRDALAMSPAIEPAPAPRPPKWSLDR